MKAEEITISSEAEEYLEAIYRLERKTGSARTMELARQLKVVPGSVTNTVESLEKRGLIVHKPYRGVKLTEKGRKLALNVLRKHRLAERLLTDILQMDWSKVHETACRLEHAIPEDMIKPLEKALKHPQTCPHGNPIPTKCGVILEEKTEPLTDLKTGESATIVKITEETHDLLQRLDTLGLRPGETVKITKKTPIDGLIVVRIRGDDHTLGHDLASVIRVRKL
jgi:DtxR family Mn-dependent transcriptional regulator